MLHLIQLELRKNRLRPYLTAGFVILLVSFLFCFMTAYLPTMEAGAYGSVPADMTIFTKWNGFIMLISTLMFSSFAVLGAVMHARFTVEEYTGKRAVLLFTFPVNRGKLLFSKCAFVFFFGAVFVFLGNIAVLSGFGLISNAFSLLSEPFEVSTFLQLIKTSGIYALLSATVGFAALWIGFWKKSLVATIVAAVVMIMPFGNVATLFPDASTVILLCGLGILLLFGLFLFIRLLSRVNRMEA